MPVYYDKHGRPIDTSFLRLLFDYNQPRTIRQPKTLKRIDAGQDQGPVLVATSPASLATAPPPAASAAAPEAPAAPAAPAASTPPAPTEGDKAAEAVSAWSETQDAILLGLKLQGKDWKSIAALVDGKEPKELKARYKELMAKQEGSKKADETTDDEAIANETKGGKEKQKGKSGKGKEPADKNKAKDKGGKGLKGILRIDDNDNEDSGNLTSEGRRIIFLDEDGNLTASELLYLFNLERKLEKRMWLELASKLFDKTGKRMSPELVKESLMNCVGR